MPESQDDLKRLKSEWDERLKNEGFKDIEDSKGRLKNPDIRTRTYQDQECVLEFFLALDSYLESGVELPPIERRILELYSCGVYIKHIAIKVDRSQMTVKNCIRKYKIIVIGRSSNR